MEYAHRGTKVEFNEKDGTFSAVIAGKRQSSPSLASIRSRIDKVLDGEFKPFTALVHARYGDKLEEVTVVGVKAPRKNKNSWRTPAPEWLLNNGETRGQLIENTPENRATVGAWSAHRAESRRISEERSKIADTMWEKVTHITPPAA